MKIYTVLQNAIDPNWSGYNSIQVVRLADHEETQRKLDAALDLLDTLRTWEYYELEHLNALDEAEKMLTKAGRNRPKE